MMIVPNPIHAYKEKIKREEKQVIYEAITQR